MLDANRVMTMNNDTISATLIVWQLPECRAVYAVGNVSAGSLNPGEAVLLSPGRKFVAAFNGQGFDLFDTDSGERRGQTAAIPQRVSACAGAAFDFDGSELATVLQLRDAGQPSQLVRWELKTGAVVSNFPLPTWKWRLSRPLAGFRMTSGENWSSGTSFVTPLAWWGPAHMLIDSAALVELDSKQIAWRYSSASHAHGADRGRCWFITSADNKHYLANLTIPDQELRQAIAASEQDTTAPVRPGSKVSLWLELTGPPTAADEFRRKLTELLTAQLRSGGLLVEDGQPTALIVKVQVADLGQSMTYRVFGRPGVPSEVSVALKKLNCQVAYMTSQDKVLWRRESSFSNPTSMSFTQTDIATEILDQQWSEFSQWLGQQVMIPFFVPAAADRSLPGQSAITPDGIANR